MWTGCVAGLVNRKSSNDIKLAVFLAEPGSYNINISILYIIITIYIHNRSSTTSSKFNWIKHFILIIIILPTWFTKTSFLATLFQTATVRGNWILFLMNPNTADSILLNQGRGKINLNLEWFFKIAFHALTLLNIRLFFFIWILAFQYT